MTLFDQLPEGLDYAHHGEGVAVVHGDCIEVMRTLPAGSVDAIVTDPPYGLGFMGKAWDALPPGPEWAAECLRVLKPGGHLLAFGGTRTAHRLAVAIEDAGFEIRDSIAWLYGSGFPKSMDVSKAIDKAARATREVIGPGIYSSRGRRIDNRVYGASTPSIAEVITAPATDDAARWEGWGTALKPAHEPIVVARKPLVGTVAANVLAHGTGALNIDACRIEMGTEYDPSRIQRQSAPTSGMRQLGGSGFRPNHVQPTYNAAGRWPANVVLDESQAAALDKQSGMRPGMKRGILRRGTSTGRSIGGASAYGTAAVQEVTTGYDDNGGASRFFYVAKAGNKERPIVGGVAHPTVKPLALMRWLVRLVTPPGGVILEPFAGSGTTVEAAMLEGFAVIGIEREPSYLPLIAARIERATASLAPIEAHGSTAIEPTLFDDDGGAA